MITDIIVGGFLALIRTLTDLIPAIPLPNPSGSNSFLATLSTANSIIPLATIILGLFAMVAVRFGLYAWDAIVWIYHQFWGSS